MEVNVTFPEEYQAKKNWLARQLYLKCTVHEIKVRELPELDDEFKLPTFLNVRHWMLTKAEVKKKIKERKEREGKKRKKTRL